MERPDGSWPGAEIVSLLCARFTERGIDPDLPASAFTSRFDDQEG